jgi:hypothetical protein
MYLSLPGLHFVLTIPNYHCFVLKAFVCKLHSIFPQGLLARSDMFPNYHTAPRRQAILRSSIQGFLTRADLLRARKTMSGSSPPDFSTTLHLSRKAFRKA